MNNVIFQLQASGSFHSESKLEKFKNKSDCDFQERMVLAIVKPIVVLFMKEWRFSQFMSIYFWYVLAANSKHLLLSEKT